MLVCSQVKSKMSSPQNETLPYHQYLAGEYLWLGTSLQKCVTGMHRSPVSPVFWLLNYSEII